MHRPDTYRREQDSLATRASLLGRLRNWDDAESWEEFTRIYWQLIYNVARGAGLPDPEARDVVQETLLGVAKKVHEFKSNPELGSSARLVSIAVSPDRRSLATINGNDKDAKLWDLASHQLKASLQGHNLSIYCVAFSPDGRLVATASVDDRCGLWGAGTGELVTMLEGHKGGTYSIAFSPDNKTVAVGCNDGELKL